MVTFIYLVIGSALITALFLLVELNAITIGDWARSTWLRIRMGTADQKAPRAVGAPPDVLSDRAHAAALAWILAIFLGALALPR